MLAVIIIIIFAIGVGYIAILNASEVQITIPGYQFSIPLYFVVLVSVLVGFVFASLLYIMNVFNAFFAMRGKNRVINKEKKTNKDLSKKVDDLEKEKAHLESEKKLLSQ